MMQLFTNQRFLPERFSLVQCVHLRFCLQRFLLQRFFLLQSLLKRFFLLQGFFQRFLVGPPLERNILRFSKTAQRFARRQRR